MIGAEEPGLFEEGDLRVAPDEEVSAGRRRTQRQLEAITQGWHPLSSALGLCLPLHPDAPREGPDGSAPGPRCGSCRFRRVLGHHDRAYGKCTFVPADRPNLTRVTHGEATDVRAWWPGCTDYEERSGSQ